MFWVGVKYCFNLANDTDWIKQKYIQIDVRTSISKEIL